MQHNTVHKGPIINEISRSLRLGIAMNALLFRNAPLLWFSMVFSPVLFGMLSMCTVLLPKYLVEAITGEYGIALCYFCLLVLRYPRAYTQCLRNLGRTFSIRDIRSCPCG